MNTSKKTGKRINIKNIAAIVIAALSFFIIMLCRDNGSQETFRWILAIGLIMFLTKPLFVFTNLSLKNYGYSFMYGLGLAVMFLITWFICGLLGIPFNTIMCYMGLAITVGICICKVLRNGGIKSYLSRDNIDGYFLELAIYILLFAIAFYVKGFKPVIDFQTEQYMDYGFMKAMYRQQSIPVEDMWLAGNNLNYYYLGQAIAVFMCRLSFITPEYGYNLMLCTIFASLSTTLFWLVYGILKAMGIKKHHNAILGGICAALTGAFGGNGHWVVYGIIKQLYVKLSGSVENVFYWFPDSTVYMGMAEDSMDKLKHEFPSYTLVLGDLHAHVCNMLFTIPLLAILFDYSMRKDADAAGGYKDSENRLNRGLIIRELFSRYVIFIGILLGLYRGVNYWDFPIYFVTAGAIILFCDLKRHGGSILTIAAVLAKGVVILLTGTVIMLPFNMYFEKMMSGVNMCTRHSDIGRFITVWGFHLVIVIALIVYIIMHAIIPAVKKKDYSGITPIILSILAFSLCGIGLLIVPEIVFVKDIYGDLYERYNTMFKLTFQAVIFFSICVGICIALFADNGVNINEKMSYNLLPKASYLFCAVVIMLAGYIVWSSHSWFGHVLTPKLRQGISAVGFIEYDPEYEDLREAISIVNADTRKNIHIIEECADSYSGGNRLSVFTGASTVAGWYVHEWMWHNDSTLIGAKSDEVRSFYSLGDTSYCEDILKKYEIDYIFVGPATVSKYQVDYNGFETLGECIWSNEGGEYRLIKVE